MKQLVYKKIGPVSLSLIMSISFNFAQIWSMVDEKKIDINSIRRKKLGH